MTTLTRHVLLMTLALAAGAAHGQDVEPRPPVPRSDYDRWEQLRGHELSADGVWLAWSIRTVGGDNELRLRATTGGDRWTFPEGRDPAFSKDGLWFSWIHGLSKEKREARADKKGDGKADEKLGLIHLPTGDEQEIDGVTRHAFDATGRYQARAAGSSLVVVDLSTGQSLLFGDVLDFAWCDVGSWLAISVGDESGVANGVQLLDATTGRVRGLDASSRAYRSLTWREDAADLAVLRSVDPAKDEGTAHTILAWRDVALESPRRFELDVDDETLDGFDVVESGAPEWSDDGLRIAFGVRPAEPDEEDGGDEDEESTDSNGKSGETADKNDEEDVPGLQVWHTNDRRIYPGQKAAESRDKRRTLLSVWHLDDDRIVRVGTDLMDDAEWIGDGSRAIERVSRPYKWGAMFGRPYHDLFAIDASGDRRLVFERARYTYKSPMGRHLMTFDGTDYLAHDLDSGDTVNLTAGLDAEFTNTRYDTPTDLMPPHGNGGWLADDSAVFLYDRFDVWRVATDGSGGRRITAGAEDETIHRLLDLDEEPGLDPTAPLYLSLRHDPTEQRGFARLDPGATTPRRLLLEDASVGRLQKAEEADVFLFRRESRVDSPDLFVGSVDLAAAAQVTETNPFQDEYAWTRSELVDFTSDAGVDLQAILLYPVNHDPSRRYPMITYTYELLSPRIHSYQAPDERRYYNQTIWTQRGYFVLMPDIVYRARHPGTCAVEAVRPAVARIVEMGLVDEERVGLIGHSWGGYQATYLPTRVHIFAASVAGAPLTDFVSFMGQIHWSSGTAEVDHWETGQARMEVPFWEDPDAHRRESPIHEVHNMRTPLLMMFGDDDGAVDWDQGTEFYNFARRAGKQMVLLVYEGEGHGLSKEPNQIDYHRRILEWFDHYLKGEPAPAWITDGVALADLDEERRRFVERDEKSGDDGEEDGGEDEPEDGR